MVGGIAQGHLNLKPGQKLDEDLVSAAVGVLNRNHPVTGYNAAFKGAPQGNHAFPGLNHHLVSRRHDLLQIGDGMLVEQKIFLLQIGRAVVDLIGLDHGLRQLDRSGHHRNRIGLHHNLLVGNQILDLR